MHFSKAAVSRDCFLQVKTLESSNRSGKEAAACSGRAGRPALSGAEEAEQPAGCLPWGRGPGASRRSATGRSLPRHQAGGQRRGRSLGRPAWPAQEKRPLSAQRGFYFWAPWGRRGRNTCRGGLPSPETLPGAPAAPRATASLLDAEVAGALPAQ